MAELRVIALVATAVLVVAPQLRPTRVAQADAPHADLTPPAGWRALPTVAAALATGARADGVVVERTEAWGDPGRGCFAVALAVRGAGATTAEQVVASLAGTPVHDVAPTTGAVTLAFERGPFHGKLRAQLDGETVRARACFGDGREPELCDAACATGFGAGRGP